MILDKEQNIETLLDYYDGKIEQGLGIGINEMDWAIRFKRGQLNVILGHDNIGKTAWCLWYFLCLSSHHNLTWVLYLAENKSWQAERDLIQMYAGKKFTDLSKHEIITYQKVISNWFKFVDNKQMYTPDEMIEIFRTTEGHGYFIDPFTALDRKFGYEANYQFLNMARQFCNETGKTLYLSSHPNTESGRAGRIYPKDNDWAGHLMPPMKDHIEGGKAFSNRVDDFIILHRLIKHPGDMKFKTMVDIAKVKDQETGGHVSGLENYVMCDWNSGLGFKRGYEEGIDRTTVEPQKTLDDDLPF